MIPVDPLQGPAVVLGMAGSVPGNPLLAGPMYLTGYIERMGTGTRDMIRRCTEAGLPAPEFAVSDGFPDDRPPGPGRGRTFGEKFGVHPGHDCDSLSPSGG